jgi:hypothetical protein
VDRRASYLAAAPWPHLVVDGLWDPTTLAQAEAQEIGPASALRPFRSRHLAKAESTEVAGPAAQAIMDGLDAPEFVAFLESLTGVNGLILDPTRLFGGIHAAAAGGFQAVHRDFRKHRVSGLFHRVNVLVYLNSEWEPAYGGELELWPPDMSACVQRIRPLAGRTVIFESSPCALHGVPEPIRCPPGRARLTLASYYYTAAPGSDDRRTPRFLHPTRPQDPWRMKVMIRGESAPYRLARRLIAGGVTGAGHAVRRLRHRP